MLRPWKINLQIDTNSRRAIYVQIAEAIIIDIKSGRLKSGDALPGSRNLAVQIKVNRNTVVEALNLLIQEEWVIAKERQGTFVANYTPLIAENKQLTNPAVRMDSLTENIRFDDGYPDSHLAPMTSLARAYRQIFTRKAKWQLMGYGSPYGEEDFREALAQMLNHQRGMMVSAEEVCITRGSQMAMYLLSQCLFTKGDYVMVENPGYQPAWKTFELAGAGLLPISVDEYGLCIDEVEIHLKTYPSIKAIYITPHHQYPTTVTLSRERRTALIQLSNTYGFSIIEDDYDNEFHFGYRPVLPLASYPEAKHIIYIGTMSKVVAPALRIGYLASSKELVDQIAERRKLIDVQGDTIMELAVLELIKDGTIKRHLKKATLYYKLKRDFMTVLIRTYLSDKVTYVIPEGGLAFWIEPKESVNWDEVAQKLKEKGIKIITPDQYSMHPFTKGIRLSYGSLNETQLTEGIKALAKAMSINRDRL